MSIDIDLPKSSDGVPITWEQFDEGQTIIEEAFLLALAGKPTESALDNRPGRFVKVGDFGAVGGVCPSFVGDLDTLSFNCTVYGNGAANGPSGSFYGWVRHTEITPGEYSFQEAFVVTGLRWIRARNLGIWSPWRLTYDEGNQFPLGATQAAALTALGLTMPAWSDITLTAGWGLNGSATGYRNAYRKWVDGIHLDLAMTVGTRTANTQIATLTLNTAGMSNFRCQVAGVGSNGTLVPLEVWRISAQFVGIRSILAVPAAVSTVHFAGVLPL